MALSVTINLLWFIPWRLPSLCTLGLKNFYTHRHSGAVSMDQVSVEMKIVHSGLILTASSEQLACSMHRLLRDQTKLKVSG